jgi:hypothetical protein
MIRQCNRSRLALRTFGVRRPLAHAWEWGSVCARSMLAC